MKRPQFDVFDALILIGVITALIVIFLLVFGISF